MGNHYIKISTIFTLAASLFLSSPKVSGMSAPADTAVTVTDSRPQQHKENTGKEVTSVKSSSIGTSFIRLFTFRSLRGSAAEGDKLLSRVKVFPNPVSDQINLSYSLSKENQVSIKVMDALGNEVATLFSQRLPAGDQNHSFSTNNKLSSGYYFIRVVAGTETVIKRISVL